jgi:hypothetical protein
MCCKDKQWWFILAGSYSDSPGVEIIRRHVADYIQRRDGGIKVDVDANKRFFFLADAAENKLVRSWDLVWIV